MAAHSTALLTVQPSLDSARLILGAYFSQELGGSPHQTAESLHLFLSRLPQWPLRPGPRKRVTWCPLPQQIMIVPTSRFETLGPQPLLPTSHVQIDHVRFGSSECLRRLERRREREMPLTVPILEIR